MDVDQSKDWDLESSTKLITTAVENNYKWDAVSSSIGKPAEECKKWFETLRELGFVISDHSYKVQKRLEEQANLLPRSSKRSKKKAARRLAEDIERKYHCKAKYCGKSYGTEGALRRHFQKKHSSIKYVRQEDNESKTVSFVPLETRQSNDSQAPQASPSHLFPATGQFSLNNSMGQILAMHFMTMQAIMAVATMNGANPQVMAQMLQQQTQAAMTGAMNGSTLPQMPSAPINTTANLTNPPIPVPQGVLPLPGSLNMNAPSINSGANEPNATLSSAPQNLVNSPQPLPQLNPISQNNPNPIAQTAPLPSQNLAQSAGSLGPLNGNGAQSAIDSPVQNPNLRNLMGSIPLPSSLMGPVLPSGITIPQNQLPLNPSVLPTPLSNMPPNYMSQPLPYPQMGWPPGFPPAPY